MPLLGEGYRFPVQQLKVVSAGAPGLFRGRAIYDSQIYAKKELPYADVRLHSVCWEEFGIFTLKSVCLVKILPSLSFSQIQWCLLVTPAT